MEQFTSFVTSISLLIENLYEKFFLRDILGKFLPGFIILFCISTLLFEPAPFSNNKSVFEVIKIKHEKVFEKEQNSTFSFLAWTAFISISYMVGFCNQTISEILGIQGAHPNSKESIFHNKSTGELDREEFYTRLNIMKSDQTNIKEKAQRERYIVIKEMSGNMVIPFLCIAGFSIAYNWLFSIMFLLLSIVSFVTHIFHRDRQCTFEKVTIKRINSTKDTEHPQIDH